MTFRARIMFLDDPRGVEPPGDGYSPDALTPSGELPIILEQVPDDVEYGTPF